MQADAAINHMSSPQVVLFGVIELSIVLGVAWFGSRWQHPGDFRLARVIKLTALCLATSLPFFSVMYFLWPWDFESRTVRTTVGLAVLFAFLAPLVTAYVLGLSLKRSRRAQTHDTKDHTAA